MSTVRWNVTVSPDTDQSMRLFLAAQGGGHKGDLSRFIEEAVRAHLFERAVAQAKTTATNMNEIELNSLIEEAIHWANKQ